LGRSNRQHSGNAGIRVWREWKRRSILYRERTLSSSGAEVHRSNRPIYLGIRRADQQFRLSTPRRAAVPGRDQAELAAAELAAGLAPRPAVLEEGAAGSGPDTVYKITPDAITESPLLSTSIQNSAHWIALGAKLTVSLKAGAVFAPGGGSQAIWPAPLLVKVDALPM